MYVGMPREDRYFLINFSVPYQLKPIDQNELYPSQNVGQVPWEPTPMRGKCTLAFSCWALFATPLSATEQESHWWRFLSPELTGIECGEIEMISVLGNNQSNVMIERCFLVVRRAIIESDEMRSTHINIIHFRSKCISRWRHDVVRIAQWRKLDSPYCRSGSRERREIEANTPFDGHRPESSKTEHERMIYNDQCQNITFLPTQCTDITFFSPCTWGFITSPKT